MHVTGAKVRGGFATRQRIIQQFVQVRGMFCPGPGILGEHKGWLRYGIVASLALACNDMEVITAITNPHAF